MSTFAPGAVAPSKPPDPTRHVLYNRGMVLGVDDFNQEFAYLAARDQTLARDLIGYGAVVGLDVTIAPDDTNPQIVVAPGLAVTPRGEIVRVTPAQCAYVNKWLESQKEPIQARVGAAPKDPLSVYVVLRYRQCQDDPVGIPGEPCRTADEYTAASRLVDDFQIDLALDPPDQREERAIRQFVKFLRKIQSVDPIGAGPTKPGGIGGAFAKEQYPKGTLSLAAFLKLLHDSVRHLGSPLDPGLDFTIPKNPILIPADEKCNYLRAAFRVWVTELRPLIHPDVLGKSCGCGNRTASDTFTEEENLLLAEVRVPLAPSASGYSVDSNKTFTAASNIIEDNRPYLLHLRLLQEELLCGPCCDGDKAGNDVKEQLDYNLKSSPGVALEYSRRDHTHGTPPLPELKGDVTGKTSQTSVVALRNIPVEYPENTPAGGQVLTYTEEKKWIPANVRAPSRLVAAGRFAPDGDPAPPGFSFRRMRCVRIKTQEPLFLCTFDSCDMGRKYVFKAEVISRLNDPPTTTDIVLVDAEVREKLNAENNALDQAIKDLELAGDPEKTTFILRIRGVLRSVEEQKASNRFAGFMLEVSDFSIGE